jgi:HK97 family phage portal protein
MIGRLFETRVVKDPGWAAWARGDDLGFMPSTGGQTITAERSLNLLVVYGCVSLISDTIGTLPVHVLDAEGDQVAPPVWLNRPSTEMDRVDLITGAVVSLLLDGNAFFGVGRDRSNRVNGLMLMDPRRVHVRRENGQLVYYIDSVPYFGELLHVKGLVMPGDVRGLSPIDAARQVVGMGLGAQEQATRFFSQGAMTPGVIQTQGSLTAEQMREIRDQWLNSHGGSSRAHLPVVLTGDAKWQGIAMTQEQAQFLETRRYTDTQIAGQLFKVDPAMLGIPLEGSSTTYRNLEYMGIMLVRTTLLPWIIRLERALTSLLPPGQTCKMNVAGLLRAELKTRFESYEIASRVFERMGQELLTVDEMRDFEDLGHALEPDQ